MYMYIYIHYGSLKPQVLNAKTTRKEELHIHVHVVYKYVCVHLYAHLDCFSQVHA